MLFARNQYLQKLIKKIDNGKIKIISGMRRCGKSTLLNELFVNYLHISGIREDHIIKLDMEDYRNHRLKKADSLYQYVVAHIKDDDKYFLLIDEVQEVEDFTPVLLGFKHINNLDTYVSGSNARFLSTDILTQFSDRGDEIKMYPLSFAEYFDIRKVEYAIAYYEYLKFGGLPYLLSIDDDEKEDYLRKVLQETYLKDVLNRHNIRNKGELLELVEFLASSVGSKFTASKISRTIKTLKGVDISVKTIDKYISYLKNAFMIDEAKIHDLKGKKIFGSEKKFFYADLGIRNAAVNFQVIEESHLMENLIFDELIKRGYQVDIGSLTISTKNEEKKSIRKNLEVDFVAQKKGKVYYIQSVLNASDKSVLERELRPFKHLADGAKKVLIIKDGYLTGHDENNYLYLNLFDFLMKEDSLDY